MRNTTLFFLGLLPFLLGTSAFRSSQTDDFCNVKGIIYIVDKQYKADVIVAMEEDESVAQMLVFKEDNRLMADTEGIWYITDNPALAQYRVFITADKRNADLTICYIEDRAFAGCQF